MGLCKLIVHTTSQLCAQCLHVGSLKSAMVQISVPTPSANCRNGLVLEVIALLLLGAGVNNAYQQ